ncbi:hypothetical protein RI543_003639 [Arxiozyma heterogenica]|uniref:Derlin n=1 Tax=Arxiozyma heterogenica TaxID=278026 RepID=A0AAN7WIT5_9SACH|nr:hypothetical protein RI543_003639 [Kazachstania heterogenica]
MNYRYIHISESFEHTRKHSGQQTKVSMDDYIDSNISSHNDLNVYYLYKTGNDGINVPLLGGNQLIFALLPLNMALVMYFVAHRSLVEVSLSFMAGHMLYYCDNVLLKLYGFDMCKTPYDYWIEWRQGNGSVED